MAPLSNATYGKASTMDFASIADRITAIAEELRTVLDALHGDAQTGAPVNQAHVNTIGKTADALTEVAAGARQAAADHAQDQRDAGSAPAASDAAGDSTARGQAGGPARPQSASASGGSAPQGQAGQR